jgi:hypothetical protein
MVATSVISATWEAEIRKIAFRGQSEGKKKVSRTTILTNKLGVLSLLRVSNRRSETSPGKNHKNLI